MDSKKEKLSPQFKALKKTDLSPMIRMGGVMAPRLLGGFIPKLDKKQKSAIDKVMPVDGKKKFYIQLADTPTPPIVIQMAQPLKMNVLSEDEVQKQGIKGLKLTVEDLQLAKEKRIARLLWRLKGQAGTLLNLSGMAAPFIKLGPGELKDMRNKAMTHFKPLMDLLPK